MIRRFGIHFAVNPVFAGCFAGDFTGDGDKNRVSGNIQICTGAFDQEAVIIIPDTDVPEVPPNKVFSKETLSDAFKLI
jgi:hypothetical protein